MADPNHQAEPAAAFLKAWSDYLAGSVPAAGSGSPPMFGAWQDFANSLGMQTDALSRAALSPEHLIAQLAPALGWSREYQKIARRMLEIAAEFQRRYAEFSKQGADIGAQALQATRSRIDAEPGLASSPMASYDAWIDSAEATYSQAAHSESFSRSLGELCNLVSAFRVERGKLLDALARHLDLPSRAEIDSLNRQIRDLNAALRPRAARKSRGPARK